MTTFTAVDIDRFYERDAIPLWRELARSPDGRDSHMMNFGYWPAGTEDLWTAQHRLISRVLAPLRADPGQFGVDVACGRGGLIAHVLRSTACTMLGVDISASQLHDCVVAVSGAGVQGRARFCIADAAALPVRAGSAGFLTCVESACHFPQKERFVRSCLTSLKPGGRLLMCDITAHRPDELVFSDYVQPVSPERWQAMLTAAGLRIERCESIGEQVFGPLRRFLEASSRSLGPEQRQPARLWRFILQSYERAFRDRNMDYYVFSCQKNVDAQD